MANTTNTTINYELLSTAIAEKFFGSIDDGKTYYKKDDVKALFEKMCSIDEKEDEALRKKRETAVKVISSRYGSAEGLTTLEEVGKELGLPRERVRQIEAKTLRQMATKLKLQAS